MPIKLRHLVLSLMFSWVFVSSAVALDKTEEQLLLDERIHFVQTMFDGLQMASQPAEIWPGFRPTETPMIIAFDDGVWFGVHLSELSGWERLNVEGGGYPLYITHQNEAGKQDKRRGVRLLHVKEGLNVPILRLSDDDFNSRDRLIALMDLVAQRFHYFARIEDDNLQNFWMVGGDDIVDLFSTRLLRAKRMASMALAREQLVNYVHTLDVNHLVNYLSLYRDLTLILGEAEMLRMQIGNIDGIGQYVAAKTALRFFPGLILKDLIIRSLSTYNDSDNIVHWLNYQRQISIGATIAFALEMVDVPDWQALVGKVPLENILVSALNLDNDELKDRAKAFMSGSLFDAMVARATDEILDYDEKVDKLVADYDKQDGLVIQIVGPVMLFGENQSAYQLDVKKITLIPDFDGVVRLPGEPAHFEVDHLPIAIMSSTEYHIPLSDNQIDVTIDGQAGLPVSMDTKWYRRFQSMSFETNKLAASIETPGFMSVDGGKVFIQLSQ